MLKMIIADDEYIVREGLTSIIPWEEYGIRIVAEAVNGQQAYDLCKQLHPDILFTDIRMPLMDGLEVAMKLKEEGSDIRVIIISGVQDFNYAKTALDINAEGYILKPPKILELKQLIKKVANSINMERNREFKMQQLKIQLRENISFAMEKFLKNLVSGYYSSEREIADKLDYFQIPYSIYNSFTIAVMQIDDYAGTTAGENEEGKQLLGFSIVNMANELLNNYEAGMCFFSNENEFTIIFSQNDLEEEKHIKICEEIIKCINKLLGIPVSIGVGRTVDGILQANTSRMQAAKALQYRFYTGNNSIIDFTDIINLNEMQPGMESLEYSNLYDAENRLMSAVKLGNPTAAALIISEIFNFLCSGKKPSVGYVQNICLELVVIASRAVFEFGENMDRIAGGRANITENIKKTANIFDLKNYILTVFNRIAEYFSKKYNQKNAKVIIKIREIINQRYMENIGVTDIAEEVYLTPNYISLIFKQETGETITEYITHVRIEAAKELLKTHDMKILEVAERVGYESAPYFSTVFKKYTGIHPQKYRHVTNVT